MRRKKKLTSYGHEDNAFKPKRANHWLPLPQIMPIHLLKVRAASLLFSCDSV